MAHKVFRDAVHDMISLDRETHGPAADPLDWGDALLLDLIDTPPLQRLRRIRQLGAAARIYPTGEHSRFSHALGVLHLAKRILRALLNRQPTLLDRSELLAIKTAALLHDLGHGPYSHVFESIFGPDLRHEPLGWALVIGHPDLVATVDHHCARLGLDPEDFRRRLARLWGVEGAAGPPPLGQQIIASQLDADRMDYLLRDAYFTGVAYGRYDLEWLLHSLRVATVDGSPRLCVDLAKGPAALESYLAARDNMYRQVYDHKTVRAFDALLHHWFQALMDCYRQRHPPPGTPPELDRFITDRLAGGGLPSLEVHQSLDDPLLDYAAGHWAATLSPAAPTLPASLAELGRKSRMLRDRKPLYRRLLWSAPEADGPWSASDLIHDPTAAAALEAFLTARARQPIPLPDGSSPPLELLVRLDRVERAPYAHLRYRHGDPVYVIGPGGRVLPAERLSPRIDHLGASRRRLVRVFVDPLARPAVVGLVSREFAHPTLRLGDDPS
ncbi:MAG: HD domain-containing protein [Magnetococcales bacterium]|nr:HD domain-containing protein [Magnetococcales bacterium]